MIANWKVRIFCALVALGLLVACSQTRQPDEVADAPILLPLAMGTLRVAENLSAASLTDDFVSVNGALELVSVLGFRNEAENEVLPVGAQRGFVQAAQVTLRNRSGRDLNNLVLLAVSVAGEDVGVSPFSGVRDVEGAPITDAALLARAHPSHSQLYSRPLDEGKDFVAYAETDLDASFRAALQRAAKVPIAAVFPYGFKVGEGVFADGDTATVNVAFFLQPNSEGRYVDVPYTFTFRFMAVEDSQQRITQGLSEIRLVDAATFDTQAVDKQARAINTDKVDVGVGLGVRSRFEAVSGDKTDKTMVLIGPYDRRVLQSDIDAGVFTRLADVRTLGTADNPQARLLMTDGDVVGQLEPLYPTGDTNLGLFSIRPLEGRTFSVEAIDETYRTTLRIAEDASYGLDDPDAIGARRSSEAEVWGVLEQRPGVFDVFGRVEPDGSITASRVVFYPNSEDLSLATLSNLFAVANPEEVSVYASASLSTRQFTFPRFEQIFNCEQIVLQARDLQATVSGQTITAPVRVARSVYCGLAEAELDDDPQAVRHVVREFTPDAVLVPGVYTLATNGQTRDVRVYEGQFYREFGWVKRVDSGVPELAASFVDDNNRGSRLRVIPTADARYFIDGSFDIIPVSAADFWQDVSVSSTGELANTIRISGEQVSELRVDADVLVLDQPTNDYYDLFYEAIDMTLEQVTFTAADNIMVSVGVCADDVFLGFAQITQQRRGTTFDLEIYARLANPVISSLPFCGRVIEEVPLELAAPLEPGEYSVTVNGGTPLTFTVP